MQYLYANENLYFKYAGRIKRKRISWESIWAFIEVCRWFRFYLKENIDKYGKYGE